MNHMDLNSTLEMEDEISETIETSKVWGRLYPLLNTIQNGSKNDSVPPIDIESENLIMGRQKDCCHPRCHFEDKVEPFPEQLLI